MPTLVTISICDVTVNGDSILKPFLQSSVAILAVLLVDLAGFSHC